MESIDRALTPEEVALRGDEIYDRLLRKKLEVEHAGKIVAIDVDSGDYTIAGTVLEASDEVLAKHQNAQIFLLRVGDSVLHRIRSPRRLRPA
jgi:hypothetical protein